MLSSRVDWILSLISSPFLLPPLDFWAFLLLIRLLRETTKGVWKIEALDKGQSRDPLRQTSKRISSTIGIWGRTIDGGEATICLEPIYCKEEGMNKWDWENQLQEEVVRAWSPHLGKHLEAWNHPLIQLLLQSDSFFKNRLSVTFPWQENPNPLLGKVL